ncbi:MAG: hypothetical protein ACKO3B_01110, partial [Bacteroidota bacterium]
MRSGILVSSLLLLPCLFGMRGEPVRFSIADDQGLVEFRQNKLERAETLNPFFEKLVQLKTTGTGSVSIAPVFQKTGSAFLPALIYSAGIPPGPDHRRWRTGQVHRAS